MISSINIFAKPLNKKSFFDKNFFEKVLVGIEPGLYYNLKVNISEAVKEVSFEHKKLIVHYVPRGENVYVFF
jgi:replication initiation and membrane attachment protein DnaB